ncbi:MAG: VanZ family protein [Dehalococcoidia bacterium]|nr:VanZ family protein [Dehalococcoidia bacterium]
MDLIRNKPRLLTVLALLIWMGIILFMSSRSSLSEDSSMVSWLGQYQDEAGHLGEYAILGLLTYAFLCFSMARRQAVMVGSALCVGFALGDEFFQSFIPNRTPETKDILLDALGATIAVAAAALLATRLRTFITRPGTSEDRKGNS